MRKNETGFRPYSVVALILALEILVGCNFGPAPNKTKEQPKTAVVSDPDPGIDLNCVIDRIQNPPEAFHYTYKKVNSQNPVDEEADFTPQGVDGTSTNSAGAHPVHAQRSDTAGWQQAQAFLTAISGAASTVALVNHSSAMVREGTESVNGYDTIRYSIDTSRGNVAEAALYRTTLGPGGFEKGAAWVTSKGCPIKFSIDTEMHLNDGTVQTDHYEEAIVKK
jgi:hypothetical protein